MVDLVVFDHGGLGAPQVDRRCVGMGRGDVREPAVGYPDMRCLGDPQGGPRDVAKAASLDGPALEARPQVEGRGAEVHKLVLEKLDGARAGEADGGGGGPPWVGPGSPFGGMDWGGGPGSLCGRMDRGGELEADSLEYEARHRPALAPAAVDQGLGRGRLRAGGRHVLAGARRVVDPP